VKDKGGLSLKWQIVTTYVTVLGKILTFIKENGRPLLNIIQIFNNALMTLTGIIIEFITISVLFLVFPQLLKINKLGQLFVFGNSTTLGVKEMFNSRTVLNGSFEISSSTRHIVGLPTRFASK
jgi:hypothetical protein